MKDDKEKIQKNAIEDKDKGSKRMLKKKKKKSMKWTKIKVQNKRMKWKTNNKTFKVKKPITQSSKGTYILNGPINSKRRKKVQPERKET